MHDIVGDDLVYANTDNCSVHQRRLKLDHSFRAVTADVVGGYFACIPNVWWSRQKWWDALGPRQNRLLLTAAAYRNDVWTSDRHVPFPAGYLRRSWSNALLISLYIELFELCENIVTDRVVGMDKSLEQKILSHVASNARSVQAGQAKIRRSRSCSHTLQSILRNCCPAVFTRLFEKHSFCPTRMVINACFHTSSGDHRTLFTDIRVLMSILKLAIIAAQHSQCYLSIC